MAFIVRSVLLFAVAAALAGISSIFEAVAAPAARYAVDPAGSRVILRVGKTGIFSLFGHAHVIAAPIAGGEIRFDADDPASSTVRLVFDTASLKVVESGEPPADVPQVQATMESKRVLDAARFPAITFESRRIEVRSQEAGRLRLRIDGVLTLHGVTRPESADVTVTIGPDAMTATGALKVRQTDFGMKPVTAGGGSVRVKDAVDVELAVVARPAS